MKVIEPSKPSSYKLVYNRNIETDISYTYTYDELKEQMEYVYNFILGFQTAGDDWEIFNDKMNKIDVLDKKQRTQSEFLKTQLSEFEDFKKDLEMAYEAVKRAKMYDILRLKCQWLIDNGDIPDSNVKAGNRKWNSLILNYCKNKYGSTICGQGENNYNGQSEWEEKTITDFFKAKHSFDEFIDYLTDENKKNIDSGLIKNVENEYEKIIKDIQENSDFKDIKADEIKSNKDSIITLIDQEITKIEKEIETIDEKIKESTSNAELSKKSLILPSGVILPSKLPDIVLSSSGLLSPPSGFGPAPPPPPPPGFGPAPPPPPPGFEPAIKKRKEDTILAKDIGKMTQQEAQEQIKILEKNIKKDEFHWNTMNIDTKGKREKKDKLRENIDLMKSDLEKFKKKGSVVKVGGGPSDLYYNKANLQSNPNMFMQQQTVPFAQYGQPIYPQLTNSVSTPLSNPLLQQQMMNPYQSQMMNPLQQHAYSRQISYLNRAMELESKLSFYVNVEVDLFPGTSVSPLQEASALCSSRYNRIRESLAKIFGFSYMAAPLDESYAYQGQKESKESKESKEKINLK